MPSLYGNIAAGANVSPGNGTSLYGGTAPVWTPLYNTIGSQSVTNAEVLLALLNNSGNVDFSLTGDRSQITANAIIDGATIYSNANVNAYLPGYTGIMSASTYYGDGSNLTGISTAIQLVGDVTATGVTGANVTTALANSGVTAGTYGADIAVPVITVDAKGRITSITTATPSAGNYGNSNVAAYLPTYTGSLVNSSTIVDLYANAATQAGAITTLQSDQTTQNVQITNLQSNAVSQQTTIDSHTTSISSLQGNAIVQESEIIALQSNAVSQQTTIDSNSGAITTLQGNVVSLQSNAATQQTAIDSKAALAGATFTGNVTAPYFIGDGSHLTGLPASYGNVDVAAYLPTYSGVLSGLTSVSSFGNISTGSFFIGNGSQLTGLPATYGNVDVAAYLPVYNGIVKTSNVYITSSSIALGPTTVAANNGIALGSNAHASSGNSISIGVSAGNPGSSATNAIAIGQNAGKNFQVANSIIIDARGTGFDANVAGFFVNPVRNDATNVAQTVFYNATTHELTYATASATYGNTQVAAYLPTYTGTLANSSTIVDLYANAATQNTSIVNLQSNAVSQQTTIDSLSTSKANLSGATFTGNVTAPYFLGNGSQLTGLPESYTNANVAAYLPTYTGNLQAGAFTLTSNNVAIGYQSGITSQSVQGIAVGSQAGKLFQGTRGIAIGDQAGMSQETGAGTGVSTGQGIDSIAIGTFAGELRQGNAAVALGMSAGLYDQGTNAVAIGAYAGSGDTSIGTVGSGQGNVAIAIGYMAGGVTGVRQVDNSIILNASGVGLNANVAGFVVDPVRNDVSNTTNAMYYNASTKEITYSTAPTSYGNANVAAYIPTYTGQLTSNNFTLTSTVVKLGISSAAAGSNGIAIGNTATTPGPNSIAIGVNAGYSAGANQSVAIGMNAGTSGLVAHAIVLNATGSNLSGNVAGFHVAPVRNDATNVAQSMYYNTTTKEVTYNTAPTSYSNVDIAAYLPTYTGNISAGNVSVTSTVSAAFLVGNGSNITGIDGGYF
jgi:hypothetical protein